MQIEKKIEMKIHLQFTHFVCMSIVEGINCKFEAFKFLFKKKKKTFSYVILLHNTET